MSWEFRTSALTDIRKSRNVDFAPSVLMPFERDLKARRTGIGRFEAFVVEQGRGGNVCFSLAEKPPPWYNG